MFFRSGSLHLCGALAAAAFVGCAAPAAAAPEEIQVYLDDMDAQGQYGLDVHVNYAATGDTQPDYPGAQVPAGRVRITPEFSYGLTPNVELGAYLPLTTFDRYGHFNADGVKFRIKYIAPKAEGQTWFWGANLEVGAVDHRVDINPWNAELKGILGDHLGPWTLAMNANLDWSVEGPQTTPATLDVDTRVTYRIHEGTEIGVENYNGMGEFRRLGDVAHNDEQVFAVVDQAIGKWNVEFGVGRGYAASEDGWVAKAIIGVPFGR